MSVSTKYRCVNCGKLVQHYKVAEIIAGAERSAVCIGCATEKDEAFKLLQATDMKDDRDLRSLNPGDAFAICNVNLRSYAVGRVAKKHKRYFVDENGRKWRFEGREMPYDPWSRLLAMPLTPKIQKKIEDEEEKRECLMRLDHLRANVVMGNDVELARRVNEALAPFFPEVTEDKNV